MDLPLEMLLKNKDYLEIARLQDEVISRLYSVDDKFTFHGGTSIWRCYGGKRFSYDLDLYAKSIGVAIKSVNNLRRYGLTIKNTKVRKGARPISYYVVSNGKAFITLEFCQKRVVDRIIATYTKVDGSRTDIFSLSPESLITEKIDAYNSRKAIKDMYDLFILAHIANVNETSSDITRFLRGIKRPVDENTLSQLVYDGLIPSFNEILDYIKRHYEIR